MNCLVATGDKAFQNGLQGNASFLRSSFPALEINPAFVEAVQHPNAWNGRRVVELEGPRRVTPNEIAATFARLLDRSVRVEVVPRDSWEALFKSQGVKNPIPRIRMLDGFNEGWIEFEYGPAERMKGSVTLPEVIRDLVAEDDAAK